MMRPGVGGLGVLMRRNWGFAVEVGGVLEYSKVGSFLCSDADGSVWGGAQGGLLGGHSGGGGLINVCSVQTTVIWGGLGR